MSLRREAWVALEELAEDIATTAAGEAIVERMCCGEMNEGRDGMKCGRRSKWLNVISKLLFMLHRKQAQAHTAGN